MLERRGDKVVGGGSDGVWDCACVLAGEKKRRKWGWGFFIFLGLGLTYYFWAKGYCGLGVKGDGLD